MGLLLRLQTIQDPVICAAICQMHSAVQESRKVSATGASTAIAASWRMVLDSPAYRGWQALRPKLLRSPMVAPIRLVGRFPLTLIVQPVLRINLPRFIV